MSRTPRKRLSAEEARERILEAAQKRLSEGGPDSIRLQDVAADLGISHPAILHHFGSREGLMHALEGRAMSALVEDLLAPPGLAPGGLDRVAQTLGDEGHARLLAWWVMSKGSESEMPGGEWHMLRDLAAALQTEYEENAAAAGRAAPDPEQAIFAIRLAAAAMFGEALLGRLLTESAGLGDHDAATHRFRDWLSGLISKIGES